MRRSNGRVIVFVVLGLVLAAPVSANIFTHILREAGEAGAKTGAPSLSHLGPVGKAATHIKGLASAPKGALAAHATAEGHWQFINREGQVFTAGTADEMRRVVPTLAPDVVAGGDGQLSLFLSEDSVFQNRAALDGLPKDSNLHVVTDGGSYAVTRAGAGNSTLLKARVKPNIIVDLIDRDLFDETVAYLGRSLNKANIRTIAFEPGAAKYVSSAPKIDAVTKAPLVDHVDLTNLSSAFGSIRGQTALVTGRVVGDKIFFSPTTGPEISRDLDELVSAATRNDVNLVVLHTDGSRQPGGRNWLWQKIELGGMSDATKAVNFGDFLDALAARRGGFHVSAGYEGAGRIHIVAKPFDLGAGIVADSSSVLEQTVSHITGEILTNAAEFHGRDKSSEQEVEARFIPGIPSFIQIPYFVALVVGILSWVTLRGWWQRIWPAPAVAAGIGGWKPMTIAREIMFFTAFLPVAGMPALLWQVLVQTWHSLTAPFRWIYHRFLRREI
jgi:hypothetical protein